jgi:hypothetical protein
MPGIKPCGVLLESASRLLGFGCVAYPGVLTLAIYILR